VSNSTFDLDKMIKKLEKEKLEREIAEMNRPFYVRPPFFGLVGSIIIAGTTILLGSISGVFDEKIIELENRRTGLQNEATLLENRKIKLEIDNSKAVSALEQANLAQQQAEQDFNEQKAKIEADLAAARLELERESSRITEQLEIQRDKFRQEKAALQSSHNETIEELDLKLSSLDASIATKEVELAELEEKLANAGTLSLLDTLRQSDGAVHQQTPINILIRRASKSEDVRRIILAKLETEQDLRMAAGMLYILHKANPGSDSFDAFLSLLRDNYSERELWLVLGGGYWSKEYEKKALDFLIESSSNKSFTKSSLRGFAIFFMFYDIDSDIVENSLKSESAQILIKMATEMAVDPKVNSTVREYLILLLSNVSPKSASALAALALVNPQTMNVEKFRAELLENLSSSQIPFKKLNGAMVALELDNAIMNASVPQWLEKKEHSELVEMLLSDDPFAAFEEEFAH